MRGIGRQRERIIKRKAEVNRETTGESKYIHIRYHKGNLMQQERTN